MYDRSANVPSETQDSPFAEERWRVRYRRCARCAVMMNRVHFAPGTALVLDVCIEHGYWLDAGKLTRMVTHVNERGVRHTAIARIEGQRKERRRLAELRDVVEVGTWREVFGAEEALYAPVPQALLRTLLRRLLGW